MKIKLSLILPSLNVASYIDECLKSVCKQSLEDIEIICIDAGSTDGTVDIIKKYTNHDVRIKYIHSEIKSYGHQVNLGISMAVGEYIGIVETDDYVPEDMYEKLYDIAIKEDCDYIKADYEAYWTQDNGNRFFITRRNVSDKKLYDRIIKPIENASLMETDWYLWSGIYKRQFLSDNNITFNETPGAAYQDIGFLYKTLIKAKRAYYIDDLLYKYCIDREASSSNSGRGIIFAHNEYDVIMQNLLSLSPDERKCLYIRMIKSFVSICSGIDAEYSKIEKTTINEHASWFVDKLLYAVNDKFVANSDMSELLWKKLNMILDDFDSFVNHKIAVRQNIISRVANSNGLVIFGCGNFGFEAYKWATSKEIYIHCFMDNNKNIWDKYINGKCICNPIKAKELSNDYLFVIANDVWADQINEQLINLGVLADNIFSFV